MGGRGGEGTEKSDAHCVADDHQHPVAVTMLPNCQEATSTAAAAAGEEEVGGGADGTAGICIKMKFIDVAWP